MATNQEDYYAEFENREEPVGGYAQLGENRFLSLEDIVNNYMVLYADDDSHGGRSMRTKVEAFAQRAIQEYNYDTLRVQTWEYEVIDRASFPMPQDFVELIGINFVDENGIERWLNPRKDSGNPRSPIQFNTTPTWSETESYAEGDYVRYRVVASDPWTVYVASDNIAMGTIPTTPGTNWTEVDQGESGYVYDSNGNLIFAEDNSYTKTKFDEASRNFRPEVLTGLGFDNRGEGIIGSYGKRYYADTERRTSNPTFYVNERDGVIDLDPILIGHVINLSYVSDGLSKDLSEIKVHKFAEQGIYEFIYYEMIARSSKVPANEKERAKRRMVAKQRQAKLRLMGLSPRDIIQTLRSQARWIKT